MIATDKAPPVVFQPVLAADGRRIDALRAAAAPAAAPLPVEELLEVACHTVASWNRRHPSLAVDLVVDLAVGPLDTLRIEQAARFALARSGLGGERLGLSVAGLDDDPALAPVPANGIARLLLPRHTTRRTQSDR